MTLQVFEGTWEEVREEIRALDCELAGQHVRIQLESQIANGTDSRRPTLAERFAGRVGRLDFEPADLAERSEELFGEIVTENHLGEHRL